MFPKIVTIGQSEKSLVFESTCPQVSQFLCRDKLLCWTLTLLTCLLAWVAAINCVVIISGTAPRTLDPGLGTLSTSTSPANTSLSPTLGSGLQAVKIQLQVHTTYWPSHELSHSVSGLHASWYVRWGLRVDVTLSQHHMLQRYKWSLPWCQMCVVAWYMRSWIDSSQSSSHSSEEFLPHQYARVVDVSIPL